jgi:hypothetical protein
MSLMDQKQTSLESKHISDFDPERTCTHERFASAVSGADAATIDIKSLPGHEGGIVASKKGNRADQIARHFGPLNRLHRGRKRELVFHAGKARTRSACKGARRSRQARGDRIVMPSSPSSVARARVNPTTPPLLAT